MRQLAGSSAEQSTYEMGTSDDSDIGDIPVLKNKARRMKGFSGANNKIRRIAGLVKNVQYICRSTSLCL